MRQQHVKLSKNKRFFRQSQALQRIRAAVKKNTENTKKTNHTDNFIAIRKEDSK